MKGFNLGEIELLGVEGMGGDHVMKGLEPFEIGDILGDPSVKGFTLGDMELLGMNRVGDWLSEGVGDIEGDP